MALELSGGGRRRVGHVHDERRARGAGFYEITGIKGEANGVAIVGLQPPGTSIPGQRRLPGR